MVDEEGVSSVINAFAYCPIFFNIEEISNFFEQDVSSFIKNSLLKDDRFLILSSANEQEEHHISKIILLRWFLYFNYKLSRIREFRLSKIHLIYSISSLLAGPSFSSIPKEIINFAEPLGLISSIDDSDDFIFPLARVFSFLDVNFTSAIEKTVEDFRLGRRSVPTINMMSEKILSQLDKQKISKKDWEMFQSRLHQKTLSEIGKVHGITRERVRQICKKIESKKFIKKYISENFLVFLVNLYLYSSPKLILYFNPEHLSKFFLLCKTYNIPYAFFIDKGSIIIAHKRNEFERIKKSFKKLMIKNPDPPMLINFLKKRSRIFLSTQDLKFLANKLFENYLSQDIRVYLSLKSIGKPAHYSEIHNKFIELFPGEECSERNVHAALTRTGMEKRYGIVWVGVNGVYALKEWGFDRPELTLYDAVKTIVIESYNKTGRPVSFETIRAEIGKHRQLINPSSFTMAVYFNPLLSCVNKNYFVPRDSDEIKQKELDIENLDVQLNNFSKKLKI